MEVAFPVFGILHLIPAAVVCQESESDQRWWEAERLHILFPLIVVDQKNKKIFLFRAESV